MDYGLSFRASLDAMEADLAEFDEVMTSAQEALTTLTQSAKQSAKTDNANNKLDDTSSGNSIQDFLAKSTKDTETLEKKLGRIDAATRRTLDNTWKTNENFIAQFNEMKNTYHQVDEYHCINWSYGHNAEQYLHSKVTQLRSLILTNANYLSNWQNIPEDAPINKGGNDLDKALVAAMGAPSSIDSVNEFVGHLRTQFRGRKGERTYHGGMANDIMNEIRNFAKTKTSYEQDIGTAKRIIQTTQRLVQGHIRSNNFSDDDKRHLIKLERNVYRMLIVYGNMINFTYRLQVEYILNRRVLVERLFEK